MDISHVTCHCLERGGMRWRETARQGGGARSRQRERESESESERESVRVHLSVRDHPPVHIENLAKQCERENTNYREHILLHLEALVKIFLGSIGRRGQLRKLALALFDLQSSVFQCTQYAEHILLGAHSIKPPVSYEGRRRRIHVSAHRAHVSHSIKPPGKQPTSSYVLPSRVSPHPRDLSCAWAAPPPTPCATRPPTAPSAPTERESACA